MREANNPAFQPVLDALHDAGGAILVWQVADDMRDLYADAHDAEEIGLDWETDCYIHPDALQNPDGSAGFYIPHQFTR